MKNVSDRIKCPRCNSTKLEYWQDILRTEYYQIDENGDYDTTDKPSRITDSGVTEAYGYRCLKCDCMWNAISGIILN